MISHAEDPFAIHDALLERVRAAYLSGDFETFRTVFALPHVVDTFEGQRTVTTGKQHRRMFDAMRAVLQDMGVIDMKRRTIEASFVAEDKIDTTFVTEYILKGYKVSEESVGNSLLVRQSDGSWKVTHSRYATRMNAVSRALIKP